MHEQPEIVGLVLHFRTPERTLACLRSLFSEGISLVVLVDNSEDRGKSLDAMQRDLDAMRAMDHRLEVVRSAQNLGFAGGVARGLELIARLGPTNVLLLNSDAQLCPGSLVKLRSALADGAIVVPRLSQRGAAPASAFACYDQLFGLVTRRPVFLPVRYASGCCLLLSTAQARPDLFDREFFFYGEDAMLGFRLAQLGVPVRECREAVVLHSGSASARNGSMFYEYHINRAHWLLSRKLARNPAQRLAFTATRCLSLPLRATVRCLRFRSPVPWLGLIAATVDIMRGRCRSFTPEAS